MALDVKGLLGVAHAQALRCGVTAADADDVAQDAVMIVLAANPAAPWGYIGVCARRLALRILKRQGRMVPLEDGAGLEGLDEGRHVHDALRTAPDQESHAIARELGFLARVVAGALPRDQTSGAGRVATMRARRRIGPSFEAAGTSPHLSPSPGGREAGNLHAGSLPPKREVG